MCGIAGVLAARREPGVFSRMLAVQGHRGPDGEGVWSADVSAGRSLMLGHRRLAILDLSENGAQPMVDSSGQFVLTFNGEIYNYLEIRGELQALGAVFRSQSDTEVILEAYKQWGADCLSRFNGMFAFALFDRVRGELFCARDRYGEKPFLYCFDEDFFAFGSEYKVLLQHPQIGTDLDERRMLSAAYNHGSGLDADRQTVFRSIQQLLPGEAMTVDVKSLKHRIWRYWKVEPGVRVGSVDEGDVFAQFRELLVDAVKLRMRSDVPVGSCLSGGLDSSAIVCIVKQVIGFDMPYHTFTGRFPGTSADEGAYAEKVTAHTRTICHEVEPTVERFLGDIPDFIWHNELPVSSSSQFAQWCVFRLAKQQGITVLLDGQGADEMLGGYEQYFLHYVQALRERGELDRLNRELPQIRARYPLALKPPLRGMRDRLPFALRHLLSNRLGMGSNMLFGLRQDVAREIAVETALPRKAGFHALANALEQDSFGRNLTTLLRYGDRNSMAHSREVRLPFCDHRIAEFVFSLPPHLLMGETQTKRLLRESMRGILPEAIRTRWNKQGFRPPQDLWFKSAAFLALARETLGSSSFRQSEYWIPGWWDRALDRIEAGDLALGWTVWHPMLIELWRKHFLGRLQADLREWRHNAGAA